MPRHGSAERPVGLFRHGRNQAVRIPRDLELPGTEATIRKVGDALIIVPKRAASLLETLKMLETLDEQLPPIRELPIEPVEL